MDNSKLNKNCFVLSSENYETDVKLKKYNEVLWKTKFPLDIRKNIDLQNLQITNIGLYSIATPQSSNELVFFINELQNKYFKKLGKTFDYNRNSWWGGWIF
jgi:hypothetical protein